MYALGLEGTSGSEKCIAGKRERKRVGTDTGTDAASNKQAAVVMHVVLPTGLYKPKAFSFRVPRQDLNARTIQRSSHRVVPKRPVLQASRDDVSAEPDGL
jgi:hypothetical protein